MMSNAGKAMTEATLVASGNEGRFVLSGNVSLSNARSLWQQGGKLLRGHGSLEIDLARVARSDSAGVALLVAWAREAAAAGQQIRFSNIPEQMRAIATACGVAAILPFDGAASGTGPAADAAARAADTDNNQEYAGS